MRRKRLAQQRNLIINKNKEDYRWRRAKEDVNVIESIELSQRKNYLEETIDSQNKAENSRKKLGHSNEKRNEIKESWRDRT